MAGPFPIVEQVGHSYRLDLSQSMQIHNIFSPDKLRLAANNSLSDQIVEPLEPVVIGNNQEWEVEKILNSCLYRKKLQYQVKWVGFDDDTTWYPASDFKDSSHWLHDFHSKYSDQSRSPQWLDKWIKNWEDGEEDDSNYPDDELPQAWGQAWFNWGGYVTASTNHHQLAAMAASYTLHVTLLAQTCDCTVDSHSPSCFVDSPFLQTWCSCWIAT